MEVLHRNAPTWSVIMYANGKDITSNYFSEYYPYDLGEVESIVYRWKYTLQSDDENAPDYRLKPDDKTVVINGQYWEQDETLDYLKEYAHRLYYKGWYTVDQLTDMEEWAQFSANDANYIRRKVWEYQENDPDRKRG